MFRTLAAALCVGLFTTPALATLSSLGACASGITCSIISGAAIPNPVTPDPNNNSLLAWNERQNVTLTAPLLVNRVFDETAPFVTKINNSTFEIAAGTIVSSHYLQYDGPRLQTTISLDSQVFAFIVSDAFLSQSDAVLGLPGIGYPDFFNRGLEGNDTTVFNGTDVDIDWRTTSPGDWTRLITAFSPAAVVPVPASLPLLAAGLGGLALLRRRRRG